MFRAVEVIANLVFPFGWVTLKVKPKCTLVFFIIFFVAPACHIFGIRRVMEEPFLAVFTRKQGCLVFMRSLAMAALVFLSTEHGHLQVCHNGCVLQWDPEASLDIGFTKVPINMEDIFWGCSSTLLVVAVLYLLYESLFCQCCPRVDSETEQKILRERVELVEQVMKASEEKGPDGIRELNITPIVGHKPWNNIPPFAGLYMDLSFVFVDFYLDISSILGMLLAGNYWFAFALTWTATTSTAIELFEVNLRSIRHEIKQTTDKGIMSDRLLDIMDREKGFEAVIALAITARSFPFTAHVPLVMFNTMFSMFMSSWNMASHAFTIMDLGMQAEAENFLVKSSNRAPIVHPE